MVTIYVRTYTNISVTMSQRTMSQCSNTNWERIRTYTYVHEYVPKGPYINETPPDVRKRTSYVRNHFSQSIHKRPEILSSHIIIPTNLGIFALIHPKVAFPKNGPRFARTSLRSDLAALSGGVTLNDRLPFKVGPPWPENLANTVSDDPQQISF